MRDVNNLVSRLRSTQRDIAKYIVLEIANSRFKEVDFKVDDLAEKFYTYKGSVSIAFDKLMISEIVTYTKKVKGVYSFRRYNWQSFDEVAEIFKQEGDSHV